MGKWDRKVRRQGQPQAQQAQPQNPGKVVATITINLHENGPVSCNFPNSAQYIMVMVASFLKVLSDRLELKEQSSIIAPPKGMVLPPHPGG